MSGQEFYYKFRGNHIVRDDGAQGIVIGYGGFGSNLNGILLLLTKPFPSRSWKYLNSGDQIFGRINNKFGFVYICEERIFRLLPTPIKYGR